jgi:hypothetical protein
MSATARLSQNALSDVKHTEIKTRETVLPPLSFTPSLISTLRVIQRTQITPLLALTCLLVIWSKNVLLSYLLLLRP